MYERHPVLLVFAGPNGSGKSTVTRGTDIVGAYINAMTLRLNTGYPTLKQLNVLEVIRNAL